MRGPSPSLLLRSLRPSLSSRLSLRSFPPSSFASRPNFLFSFSRLFRISPQLKMTEEGTAPPEKAEPTIFTKIINKEIPSDIVYEDDQAVAFRDVNPTAPVHILVVPRRQLTQLSKAKESDKELLGHLLLTASKVAAQEGLDKTGFRLVINDGKEGCQSLYHLHIHLVGGKQLSWPPGTQ